MFTRPRWGIPLWRYGPTPERALAIATHHFLLYGSTIPLMVAVRNILFLQESPLDLWLVIGLLMYGTAQLLRIRLWGGSQVTGVL